MLQHDNNCLNIVKKQAILTSTASTSRYPDRKSSSSPMAENETLDLRRSPRWNQARRLIREGASPDELALEVLRVLSLMLKKLPLATFYYRSSDSPRETTQRN